jgi:hypothetical protein
MHDVSRSFSDLKAAKETESAVMYMYLDLVGFHGNADIILNAGLDFPIRAGGV